MMFEEKTRVMIEDKYVEMVCTIIDELRARPAQNIQDSIQLPFSSLWEAFIDHMQHEEDDDENFQSVDHIAILEVCQRTVQELTLTELKLVWLVSEGASIWEEDDDFPDSARMLSDVIEELMSWIEQEAEEPELESSAAYELASEFESEEDDERTGIYPEDKTRH